MHPVAEYLGLTDEEYEQIDPEIHENSGSTGDMVYNYYFNVPEHTPQEILKNRDWKIGQIIDLPINIFDQPED